MTKGTLTAGTGNEKPPGYSGPVYVPIPDDQVTTYTGPVQGVNQKSATVMYVLSILATFCCVPLCGIIGLVHAMIAQHEGERGNVPAHQRRLHQAKCWTGWSIALGLGISLAFVIYTIVVMVDLYGSPRYWCRVIDWDWDMAYNQTDVLNATAVPEIIYN